MEERQWNVTHSWAALQHKTHYVCFSLREVCVYSKAKAEADTRKGILSLRWLWRHLDGFTLYIYFSASYSYDVINKWQHCQSVLTPTWISQSKKKTLEHTACLGGATYCVKTEPEDSLLKSTEKRLCFCSLVRVQYLPRSCSNFNFFPQIFMATARKTWYYSSKNHLEWKTWKFIYAGTKQQPTVEVASEGELRIICWYLHLGLMLR